MLEKRGARWECGVWSMPWHGLAWHGEAIVKQPVLLGSPVNLANSPTQLAMLSGLGRVGRLH